MEYWKTYSHVVCDKCGGIIGSFDRSPFICEKCGKEFDIYNIKHDSFMLNNKTGWIFPMVKKGD